MKTQRPPLPKSGGRDPNPQGLTPMRLAQGPITVTVCTLDVTG